MLINKFGEFPGTPGNSLVAGVGLCGAGYVPEAHAGESWHPLLRPASDWSCQGAAYRLMPANPGEGKSGFHHTQARNYYNP